MKYLINIVIYKIYIYGLNPCSLCKKRAGKHFIPRFPALFFFFPFLILPQHLQDLCLRLGAYFPFHHLSVLEYSQRRNGHYAVIPAWKIAEIKADPVHPLRLKVAIHMLMAAKDQPARLSMPSRSRSSRVSSSAFSWISKAQTCPCPIVASI